MGKDAGGIIYVEVPSAASTGTITLWSNGNQAARKVYLNSGNSIQMSTAGASSAFVATDVANVNGGYYVKLVNSDASDYKFNQVKIALNNSEAYPTNVVDPVFSVTPATISTTGTSQIQVGSKGSLDGITLSNISYGTSGIVTVNAATGVVTAVAAGTTTINFDSEAVASAYNASTNNTVTITVIPAIAVYDGEGLTNEEIILKKSNINLYDYLSFEGNAFQDKGWAAPYDGEFLDMKTGRKIFVTMKNVSTFELYLNGSADRDYSIKVGEADSVVYTQISGSGFVSSGVIETGTTGQVTIKIEGGEATLYPAFVKVNPSTAITPDHEYVTYVTTKALDFTDVAGLDAYVATGASGDVISLTEVGAVPANTPLLLHGTASTTYNVPLAASASAPAENLLVAGTGADINSASKYVLTFQDPNYVFAATNEHAATVPEDKAYLDLSGANAPSVIRIVENTTNIMNVNDVENAVKFIENGKLYIKKNGVTYNVVGAVVK